MPALPHVLASRVDQPPVVDGRLDDPAWSHAPVNDHFTQQLPNGGAPPSERTVMRVVYDAEALYVGVHCEQRTSPIMRRLTRRDRDSESEWIGLFLDTRGEGKDAFYFAVNVQGVQMDGTVHNQNVMSLDWDENWEAVSALDGDGWSVEIKIPFRIVRFPAGLPVQDWGFQVVRYIAVRQEVDQWAFLPRDNVSWVANFGRLESLRGIESKSHIELRPFVSGRVRRQDAAADTLAHGYDVSGTAGLDLKLHLTESLTLDGAVNPDFAQVEADQVILNLSNYETFLPEKRALFLEGADAFSTPMQDQLLFGATDALPNRVFYSRRIGSSPLVPTLRADAVGVQKETLYELPSPSTIFGAAKVVGTLGSRWSVGAISAFTGRNDLTVVDNATLGRSTRLVDPATLFNAVRIKRGLGDRAHVGLIATGMTRFDPASGYPLMDPGTGAVQLCPSGATPAPGTRCFQDAYVAALDGLWRSASGNYVMAAQATGSMSQEGPPRLMPDGTVISSGDRGAGGWMRAAREGGKHIIWSGEYSFLGRKLNYNDVGYMARQNLHEAHATLAYRTFEPGAHFLETYAALSAVGRWNLDGLDVGKTFEAMARGRLTNFWIVTATADVAPGRFDDREIGDGVALERQAWQGAKLEVASDPRRRVMATVAAQWAHLTDGEVSSAQASISLNLLPQLELGIDPLMTYASGEYRYASRAVTAGSGYVFGRLLARSVGATLRAGYTFTTRLTLQAYAQLFLASGHYTDLLTAPQAPAGAVLRVNQLTPVAGGTPNPDFEEAALNVNLVLRWEYRLGSTIYLVYTRAQSPDFTLAAGQMGALRLGSVRDNPAVDVVLLKAAFWWAS